MAWCLINLSGEPGAAQSDSTSPCPIYEEEESSVDDDTNMKRRADDGAA